MRRLVNKVALRKYALEIANDVDMNIMPAGYVDSVGRQWDYGRCFDNVKRYTSVSVDFYDVIDTQVKKMVIDHIKKNPPRGKTVR
jgi:hypothetical protein